jgi:TrmH family RNA methyltransferase
MRHSTEPQPIVIRALPSAPSFEFSRSLRDRCIRDKHGLYLAEGARFLCAAVDNGAPIAGLITCPQLVTSEIARTLLRKLRQLGLPTTVLPKRAFEDLVLTKEAQGVQLILRQDWQPLRVGRLWLGLESIRSPGNLGTLLRSADAAGATGLVVFGNLVDPFDPSCVRATMGSIFRHCYVRSTHHQFRKWPGRKSIRVIAATAEASEDYRQTCFCEPTMIMLGDEREGLSQAQRKTKDTYVSIPMIGTPDSLNVAMAGTLLLFEALRQRDG